MARAPGDIQYSCSHTPTSALNLKAGGPEQPAAFRYRRGWEAKRVGGAGLDLQPSPREGKVGDFQGVKLKGGQLAEQGKQAALRTLLPAFSAEQESLLQGLEPRGRQRPKQPPGRQRPKQPPARPPGEAEAVKGRASGAGVQPGAGPWACSVRINCWLTGWTRE